MRAYNSGLYAGRIFGHMVSRDIKVVLISVGKLTEGTIFLQEDSCPFVTHTVQDQMNFMLWKMVKHPANSAGLSPQGFHILGPLKKAFKCTSADDM
jgi:hypothetical protein